MKDCLRAASFERSENIASKLGLYFRKDGNVFVIFEKKKNTNEFSLSIAKRKLWAFLYVINDQNLIDRKKKIQHFDYGERRVSLPCFEAV